MAIERIALEGEGMNINKKVKCVALVSPNPITGEYSQCGREAKFTTTLILGRNVSPVCGIHRKAFDRRAEKCGLDKCKPIIGGSDE